MLKKLGCLILAGGQGSRLGFNHPKGTFGVTLVKKKSLFQLFFEKIKAASDLMGYQIPVAVMTSESNHEETLKFLKNHRYFGLDPESVSLFQQNSLPLLDDDGREIHDEKGDLKKGSSGNGGALKAFYEAGIWKKWRAEGIEFINVIPIDNPLADPVAEASHADIVIKCVPKAYPEEKVGVVIEENGKVKVVEYTELSEEQRKTGHLANTGIYSFSMEFIKTISTDPKVQLPLHKQRKKISLGNEEKEIWKNETFIFDLFPYAKSVKILNCKREETFAPLKDQKSIEPMQEALLNYDRQTYFRISGVIPSPDIIFELDPVFYYPTPALLEEWKGKPLPEEGYIEPNL